MTWSDFYLICFAVGFCFSFFSFIFAGARSIPGTHGSVGHAPGAGHGTDVTGGHGSTSGNGRGGASVSPFNPSSTAAFLAWFGGTGYLLSRFSAFWVGTALLLSVIAGLAGGAIIFLFLSKVLISDEECLDPADFEMVGVLGKLSVQIRKGGTGELIYSQMGTRRVCGARSEDGSAMVKGTEVVVTRYDKGIAYVQLWSEMSGELDEASSGTKTQADSRNA